MKNYRTIAKALVNVYLLGAPGWRDMDIEEISGLLKVLYESDYKDLKHNVIDYHKNHPNTIRFEQEYKY